MSFYNHRIPSPKQLADIGIRDSTQAFKNLDAVLRRLGQDSFAELMPSVLGALSRSADPDMALNNFERLAAACDDVTELVTLCRTRSEILFSLVTVFGASRFLSSFLIAAADDGLKILSEPGYLASVAAKGDIRGRLAGILKNAKNDKDLYRFLRRFRKQEMLRIALRDLLGKAELRETVEELSDLAEACLRQTYEWFDASLREKHGRPVMMSDDGTAAQAGFAVIAMGKLGGRELNFSSDIDIMYVYSFDGETEGIVSSEGVVTNKITNHQYFIKLAEKITSAIGENTEDGFVFRVDLRLRPEGQRGPLAQSLGGYEIYYESWGQTWERAALLKARPVAGDETVGREFTERIAPFVNRKYLDYSAISEIREMKQKINKDVEQKGKTYRDVKLGYGGIREIEFLIQALQLIYAGRDKALREKNTLKALHVLAQKGLLTYQEIADLSKAYIFLRTVEHRIQILNDVQTQTIPEDAGELRALARRSGYFEQGREAERFLRDYAEHTRRVRSIYDDLFAFTGKEPEAEVKTRDYSRLLEPETTEQEAVALLSRYGFRDTRRAYRNLFLLLEGPAFVHQTPRGRRLFHEIFPLLFEEIFSSPDPDSALNNLESYLAAQGSWDAFQSRVKQDPLAIKTLVTIFGNSEYFSRMLVSSPGLLEDMLDSGRLLGVGTTAAFSKDIASIFIKTEGITEKLDSLRRIKHREEIRIGMADLLSAVSPQAASRTFSRLAEVCLNAALGLAVNEISKRYSAAVSLQGLAVIAVGKLGGRELTYGSDLDILFVFSEEHAEAPPTGITLFEYYSKIAEKTISYLTTMTREGFAYRVDTRLRPTGAKGPLVQSIAAFQKYYSTQAETWERQALIHSRYAAGDRRVGEQFINTLQELIYRDYDIHGLAADIRAMRKRMEDEIGKENAAHYNVKQGEGGLVDIEFIAQFLQLAYGRSHRWLKIPGTYNALRALYKKRLLKGDDYIILKKAYLFLRLLENRMRIVTNQAANTLSKDPAKLHPLARRMGYRDDTEPAGRKLLSDYERTSREVREIFNKVVLPR